jgi:hypothetical protein
MLVPLTPCTWFSRSGAGVAGGTIRGFVAKYRPFHVGFWDDPDIEPFSPDEKLVYAFLFTNRLTTESGIYSISEKFIAERTGITINKINTILNTLTNTYHKITYDRNIVFVHGFMRRNFKGSPEKLELSILSNVTDHPSILCWTKFLEIYNHHHICIKIKEVLKSLQCVIDTSIGIGIEIVSLNSSSLVLSSFSEDSPPYRISFKLWLSVKTVGTAQKPPDLQKWAEDIRKMHDLDKRPWDLIYQTMLNARADSFWIKNLKSAATLRQKMNEGKLDRFVPLPEKCVSDEEFEKNVKEAVEKEKDNGIQPL